MVVTKYDAILLNFKDIKDALWQIFLGKANKTTPSGTVASDDELSFLINKFYVLLENYEWSWARKSDAAACLSGSGSSVASTSAYRLPLDAREKKSIAKLFSSETNLKEYDGSVNAYRDKTFNRGSSNNGTPREFAYIHKYTTARAYSTGTITGTTGEYTLTGVGTSWLANLCPGSTIKVTVGGATYTVIRVNSDTSVTLNSSLTTSPSTGAYVGATTYPQIQVDFNPIPAEAVAYTMDYYQKFYPLVNDSDEPLLPLNDRWILVDGAYSLYKWFHDEILKSGVSPSVNVRAADMFVQSPASVQKFVDMYVAKLLTDDKKIMSVTRTKHTRKRGY